MKIHELLEARKNPELNPKTSINEALHAFVEKHGSSAFISFTSLDKLGINPQSEYDTPLGIYAYPGTYAAKTMGRTQSGSALPFAGSNKFATLFTASNGIVDLAKITDADNGKFYQDLLTAFPNKKDELSEAADFAGTRRLVHSEGGYFWALTLAFAKSFHLNTPVVWNKIFRTIGINGCVDSAGEGIIHGHEPTQAVFFKKPGIIQNEIRVYNKYAPAVISNRIATGKENHENTLARAKLRKENFPQFLRDLYFAGNLDTLKQSDLDTLTLETVFTTLFGYTAAKLNAEIDNLSDGGSSSFLETARRFVNAIKGKRWTAGEPVIFSDFNAGLQYLTRCKEKFKSDIFETKIIEAIYDPESADLEYIEAVNFGIKYAEIMNERWPRLEKAIINTAKTIIARSKDDSDDEFANVVDASDGIYNYAKRVIRGPWTEAEQYIIDEDEKQMYDRMIRNLAK